MNGEIFTYILGEFISKPPWIGEQPSVSLPHYKIGKEDRTIGNIISSKIGYPGNVIQGRNNCIGSTFLYHGITNHGELLTT